MTTDPDRLLGRSRYNNANHDFIDAGGKIRRVYMVSAGDLENSAFMSKLRTLARHQFDHGVNIGLLNINEIAPNLRKDFILYDDSILLVEDQQADSDYVLARSTAYFGCDEISTHRLDFEDVWEGKLTSVMPQKFAHSILLDKRRQKRTVVK